LELLLLPIENRRHQSPQRLVADVRLGKRAQFLKHRLDIVSRRFDELHRIETVGLVRFLGEANLRDVDLRAVGRMLGIDATDFVEFALQPMRFTGFEPGAVVPGHIGCAASAIAEFAGVIRFAIAPRAACAFRQKREKSPSWPGSNSERRISGGRTLGIVLAPREGKCLVIAYQTRWMMQDGGRGIDEPHHSLRSWWGLLNA
jgi:hypothetical protein